MMAGHVHKLIVEPPHVLSLRWAASSRQFVFASPKIEDTIEFTAIVLSNRLHGATG